MRKCNPYWLVCCGVTGLTLIIGGVMVIFFFNDLITSVINSEIGLKTNDESSKAYKTWQSPPVTPQTKVYFFNLTNQEDFIQGRARPKFDEVGPYVYTEKWEKVHIKFNPNKTVTYQQKKTFYFSKELSYPHTEQDSIVALNAPMVTGAYTVRNGDKLMRSMFASLARILKVEPFEVRTIRELMWGFSSPLLEMAKEAMPEGQKPPFEKFGYFVDKNGTSPKKFTVNTGEKGMDGFAMVNNVGGKKKLDFWGPPNSTCNMINGTDGTSYPPGISRETVLYMFQADLCRSVPLVYKEDVEHNGIDTYRFGPPDNVFATPLENPANKCFYPDGPPYAPSGFFNISKCQFGSPVMLSFPHFYKGDKAVLNAVEGLNPVKEKHEFYMDFVPAVTVAMEAKARMQINFLIKKVEGVSQFQNLSADVIYPALWFESGIDELPPKIVAMLDQASNLPQVAEAAMTSVLFALGGCLFLISIAICIFTQRSKWQPKCKDKNGVPHTNGVQNGKVYPTLELTDQQLRCNDNTLKC